MWRFEAAELRVFRFGDDAWPREGSVSGISGRARGRCFSRAFPTSVVVSTLGPSRIRNESGLLLHAAERSVECSRVQPGSSATRLLRACCGLTSRQSQRRDLSRIVLTHAPRQLPSWLIFNVRQEGGSGGGSRTSGQVADTRPVGRFLSCGPSEVPAFNSPAEVPAVRSR